MVNIAKTRRKRDQGRRAVPLDSVLLNGLSFPCRIGVSAAERRLPTTIEADVEIECDLRHACASDRIADTINYAFVAKAIVRAARSGRFALLEALADRIATVCLASPLARAVTVTVRKKGVIPSARAVGVTIRREA